MKRGEVQRRFDPNFHLPGAKAAEQAVRKLEHRSLRSITALCYRYPGFYGIEYRESGIRVLKGENITRDGEWRETDATDFISPEVNQKFPLTQVKEGDLVMSVRGEVGKVACVTSELAGSNLNANTIRIALSDEAKRTLITSEFVWMFLNSVVGQRLIKRAIAGGVQETITAPEILDVLIPTPKLDIQRKLVAEMQAARETRKQKLLQADELLAGLDVYLLDTLGLTLQPGDERIVFGARLRDVRTQARMNADYFHPERTRSLRALSEESAKLHPARLIDAVEFRRDQLKTPEGRYLGLAHVQSHTGELVETDEEASGTCFRFARGDVLFARLRPYLNKVWSAEFAGCCSTEFHVLRVRPRAKLLPDYLATILRSRVILAQTRHMMTGNTHPRLANDDVVNLVLPVPDETVQRDIAAEVRRRREDARHLRSEAEAGWAVAKSLFEEQSLRKEAI